ncbi:MAG TPA: homoserine dehydrogenase [Hyphomicrobiales bacterium]|nr:homoserine dehydrogenase [Kaistiaceae bacterium]HQF30975.1 homoserine dehydrogenase [Hyphomicrobiales bacterium]
MSDPLKLGIAGLGTVGGSVARLLHVHANDLAVRGGRAMPLVAVCDKDRDRDRGVDLSALEWFPDPVTLATSDRIDVYIETIGGEGGIAYDSVRAALEAGKHVVTANKALLAKHAVEFARIAERTGASLNFEAAVAGGIPVVKTLREALAGNSINRVYGILNGTCNYILTRMEQERIDFGDCLAAAQKLGYAEADPTFDIEGNDTAHKLALLTSLAFGTETASEEIYVEGITSVTLADIEAADELGYRIKLLGVAMRTDTGIEQRVHPTMVPKSTAIARIDGVLNAVAIDGDFVGEVVLVGRGAGGNATASAIVSDIVDIARDVKVPMLGRPADTLEPYRRAAMRAHEGGYYVRCMVHDRPGAFAAIAARMAEHKISLESIVQRRRAPRADAPGGTVADEPQPVIMITYETSEAEMRAALDAVEADGHVAAPPRMIRIERL